MEIRQLDAEIAAREPFAQGYETDGDLLPTRDMNVAPSKSRKPHISARASASSALPNVTLLSEHYIELSRTLANENGSAHGTAPHLIDCATLTAMQLRKKYPREANCHRNMLQREKDDGRKVEPRYRKFRDFLADVRPKANPKGFGRSNR